MNESPELRLQVLLIVYTEQSCEAVLRRLGITNLSMMDFHIAILSASLRVSHSTATTPWSVAIAQRSVLNEEGFYSPCVASPRLL